VATLAHDELIGAEVAGYRVDDRLGEGAIGIVYRAHNETTGAQAAIKVVRPELAGDTRYAMTVIDEARAVSSIGHAGIVSISISGCSATGAPSW
jgi:serine/threonine-protein kinase